MDHQATNTKANHNKAELLVFRKKRVVCGASAEKAGKTRTVKPVPIKFAQHQTMALNDVADPGISETAASKMCSCLCEAAAG
jgi:succinate dehydrogenase/fumarate reductase flavoprotein subunit